VAVVIKRAIAGRMVGGKFRRGGTSQNIAQGFYVGDKFHPIRSSPDYDPARAGEGGKKKKKAKTKAKAKAAPKKKTKSKAKSPKKKAAKKRTAKKKTSKKKGRR